MFIVCLLVTHETSYTTFVHQLNYTGSKMKPLLNKLKIVELMYKFSAQFFFPFISKLVLHICKPNCETFWVIDSRMLLLR